MADTWIIIRHPHKDGEEDGIYLGDTALITERGRQEMKLIIPRLKLLNPTVITCSQLPRAIILAEHIAAELGLPEPVKTGLLNEIDKPRHLIGMHRDSPQHEGVMRPIREGWNADVVPTYVLCGEKIRSRTEVERDLHKLFRMVETFPATSQTPVPDVLLSVTHAKLTAAIGHMVWRRDGTLLDYYNTSDSSLKVSTTGISILRREPNRRDPDLVEWHIQTWNEESHTDIGFDEEFRSLIKDI